jgi:coenzyme F420 hydrogenase subunit delta
VSLVSFVVNNDNTMKNTDYLPEFCTKDTLILGCGNILFGDDGFGPAVVNRLTEQYDIPENVYVMDVGTGIRKLLFTLCLSPELPENILIIDAVDKGKRPGEIFELTLEDVPYEKTDDFSMHQAPSSNLAVDLQHMGVYVRVLGCQIGDIPDQIQPGLTKPVQEAVEKMCAYIIRDLLVHQINGLYD